MIYTCYEMIRDCREGRDDGWSYFVANYTPVIRRIVAQYLPQGAADGLVERLLVAIRQPQSPLFQSNDPAPERWFVAEMRQMVLGSIDGLEAGAAPEIELDLALMTQALGELTVVEKNAAWLETMHYAPKESGTLLRMEPRTVEKIRERAAGLLRGALDTWRRTVLADNGRALGRLASAARTPDCPPAKAFLDVLDGRSTWQTREQLQRHVTGCWYCIDHYCRMAEVLELVRGIQPLSEEEADKFRRVLGIKNPGKKLWQRWFTAR